MTINRTEVKILYRDTLKRDVCFSISVNAFRNTLSPKDVAAHIETVNYNTDFAELKYGTDNILSVTKVDDTNQDDHVR